MSSAGNRTALLKYQCLTADKWSRYPAIQDVNMACNSFQDVSGMTFCDGDIINSNTVLFDAQTVTLNSDSVTAAARIYQEIDPSSSYEAVDGFYGLAKDVYPALNPSSSGAKTVTTWTQRTTPNTQWRSVTWSPELSLFVAVANAGTNRIMSSSNGITWTEAAAPSPSDTNGWRSVAWSPQLKMFVAVAASSVSSATARAMYSYTGTGGSWALGTGVPTRTWSSVCWSPELGLFVAVSEDGDPLCVMTSSDGIAWTPRTGVTSTPWSSICWSPELQLFVAVSRSGTADCVMTSIDGITWTSQSVARTDVTQNLWNSVCWSSELGLFVAVAGSGVGTRAMTSPDGITWTIRTTPAFSDIEWTSVVWCAELGLFLAISVPGSVMYSPNGINWTLVLIPVNLLWRGLCWSPELGIFVGVANTDSASTLRVFTSSLRGRPPTSYNVFDSSFNSIDQSGNWAIQQVLKVGTATSSVNTGPTPSVAGVNVLYFSHTSGPVTITDLTDGVTNQRVTLVFNNGNTTISNSGDNFRLSAAPFGGTQFDTLTLVKADTGKWVEVARSVNA